MLSEGRQKKTNAVLYHSHVESEKAELVKTKGGMVDIKGWGLGELGDTGQSIPK